MHLKEKEVFPLPGALVVHFGACCRPVEGPVLQTRNRFLVGVHGPGGGAHRVNVATSVFVNPESTNKLWSTTITKLSASLELSKAAPCGSTTVLPDS